MGYTKTFIQVLTTILSEHTIISYLDTKVPTCYNIDTIMLDLRELRNIFKLYLNKQIIIPRDQWNITRCRLVSTILKEIPLYALKIDFVVYYITNMNIY